MNRNEKPSRSRGSKRMAELAGMAEVERAKLEAAILGEIGRTPPSTLDQIAVETLAASVIRARRLRASGKSDAEERKTIVQVIRATGLRPAPPAPAAPLSIEAMLAARGYAPPDQIEDAPRMILAEDGEDDGEDDDE